MKNTKRFSYLILLFGLMSCGVKKASVETVNTVSSTGKYALFQQSQKAIELNSLRGRLRMTLNENGKSQTVSSTVRFERDSALLISAPFGVIKAYLDQKRLSYYNKLERSYFDGDYKYLQELIGVELNFTQLQNLLFAKPLIKVSSRRGLILKSEESYWVLSNKNKREYDFSLKFDKNTLQLIVQDYRITRSNQAARITYAYKKNADVLPTRIKLKSLVQGSDIEVDLQWTQSEYNRKVQFNYNIPQGYKSILE
tara:strand:+ start:14114 stop:14875 length:762 start_codon:yes stop_codon:yes gene_type:complete